MIKSVVFATAALVIGLGLYFVLTVSPTWVGYTIGGLCAWIIAVVFLEALRR